MRDANSKRCGLPLEALGIRRKSDVFLKAARLGRGTSTPVTALYARFHAAGDEIAIPFQNVDSKQLRASARRENEQPRSWSFPWL